MWICHIMANTHNKVNSGADTVLADWVCACKREIQYTIDLYKNNIMNQSGLKVNICLNAAVRNKMFHLSNIQISALSKF